ncbi:TIGR03564 family F420-dependent LLM class oxidoreductase [Nocardia pseudobrasiliensis]|uniref:F420-dependent oxidoreductase-like protein n=1 Tax=Nocardia pseudobrasiliensis TaxID=45979 RepID=A0A370HZZ8_9NOCA|nr:TIGR03564 family F420-dependent LLM class oxidoreductase [Nocardia pseudobrasiliensis]RDI64083.1 F420-dependent oxidoreductase-like protein [Nocardia pseudobrasiliensis]
MTKFEVPIGVSLWPRPEAVNDVADVVELTREAQGVGLRGVWFGQKFDLDSLVLAGVVGQAVGGIGVGTSVVPIGARHPVVVGSQAQTAQAASGGRFRLGVGFGAAAFDAAAFGVVEDRPVLRLREYLTVLREVIERGGVEFAGERVRANPPMSTAVRGGGNIPLLVAAMGPQALRVTGELADGVLPFLAGPRTLGTHILPRLERVRPERRPQVVAGVVAVVTDRVEEVRARAAEAMSFFENVPSYRAVLDREGAGRAVELALIGDEEYVARGLREYIEAGATELLVTQTDLGGPADRQRTWRLLGELSV